MSEFTIFSRGEANAPTPERARWVLGQMEAHGLLPDLSDDERTGLTARFRTDLYGAAMTTLPNFGPTARPTRHTIRV